MPTSPTKPSNPKRPHAELLLPPPVAAVEPLFAESPGVIAVVEFDVAGLSDVAENVGTGVTVGTTDAVGSGETVIVGPALEVAIGPPVPYV